MLKLPHENQLQGHTRREAKKSGKWGLKKSMCTSLSVAGGSLKLILRVGCHCPSPRCRDAQVCFLSPVFFGNESERKPLKRKMEIDGVFTMNEATQHVLSI